MSNESMSNESKSNYCDLRLITRFAQDIAYLAFQAGISLDEAGRRIEAQLDGTQPDILMPNAVGLAKTRHARRLAWVAEEKVDFPHAFVKRG